MSLSSDVIERLVVEVTGANRVLVFDHTIRRRVWGGVDRAHPRQPVTSVYNDYTVKSGRKGSAT